MDRVRMKPLSKLPAGIPATEQGAEKVLLDRLKQDGLTDDEYLFVLWQLACFYNSIPRVDLAEAIIPLMTDSSGEESEALSCLRLGQLAEQRQDYGAGVEHYMGGLALKPINKYVSYFLHNNLGYCLNLQGKHVEAEHFCREAIAIESARANAYKNLGLALVGQGDVLGAAWTWIEATKIDASDVRSFHSVIQLMMEHPELDSQFTGIYKELEDCREAIETTFHRAVNKTPLADYGEICRLKHLPGKGYLIFQDGVERQISAEAIEHFYTVQALVHLDLHINTWVSILAETKKKKHCTSKKRVVKPPIFKSRSDYLAWLGSVWQPCLIIQDQAVDHVREH
jgi:tetratricopeptide (TPR) repeat protein